MNTKSDYLDKLQEKDEDEAKISLDDAVVNIINRYVVFKAELKELNETRESPVQEIYLNGVLYGFDCCLRELREAGIDIYTLRNELEKEKNK
jgi:hypothetical protein